MSARIVSGIYLIRNTVNGKIYVGSAKSLERRWIRHKTYLRRGDHHSSLLQRAWNKYGRAAFAFSCLEVVEHKEDLVQREQAWLNFFRACDREWGYNIQPTAGSCLGMRCSDATKAKLSLANKGQGKGSKLSAETRAKMSLALRNRPPRSAEYRANISQGQKRSWETRSRTMSAQGRVNISESLKGRVISEEWRAKISAAHLGRKRGPMSDEHKAKLSLAHRSNKLPAETIEKLRQAARKRWRIAKGD